MVLPLGPILSAKIRSLARPTDQLLKRVADFGPVVEEPKKTSIHLVNVTAFAGVTTRRSAIVLTIKSDRKLSSPRIQKSEQVSANRFRHELRLSSPRDVDKELVKWLKEVTNLAVNAFLYFLRVWRRVPQR